MENRGFVEDGILEIVELRGKRGLQHRAGHRRHLEDRRQRDSKWVCPCPGAGSGVGK